MNVVCAMAMIGVTVYIFAAFSLFNEIGITFINGLLTGWGPIFVLVSISPAIIGAVELLLCIVAGFGAMMDQWYEASIRNVCIFMFPRSRNVKRIPLTCDARRTYFCVVVGLAIGQFVTAAILLIVANKIANPDSVENVSAGSVVSNVLNFEVAMFDECCAKEGWTPARIRWALRRIWRARVLRASRRSLIAERSVVHVLHGDGGGVQPDRSLLALIGTVRPSQTRRDRDAFRG